MTTSWPPGVSALDVSELFHVGETPNKSSFYVLCIMYIVAMGDFVDLLRSAIQGIFGSLRS